MIRLSLKSIKSVSYVINECVPYYYGYYIICSMQLHDLSYLRHFSSFLSQMIRTLGTSIGLVPSGRIAVAGFTDGTLRLFDLTGSFAKDKNHPDNYTTVSSKKKKEKRGSDIPEGLFDDDASDASDDDASFHSNTMAGSSNMGSKSNIVNSHSNQQYGAVACQIHARGVHTSLLMDVAVSEDGLYAFGGVQRGSVELAAVYLGDVEGYLDDKLGAQQSNKSNSSIKGEVGILDLIQIDRHADAKLKGFGACTRLWNGWDRVKNEERPEYLLFTGKGIKNIHIWSFKPSNLAKCKDSVWTCLYDTQTNGTSIHQLYFRHNAHGTLQGISKSDDQKLRVWDLGYEQRRIAQGTDSSDRPKRPDYVDCMSTEGTIGVCGPLAFASGSLGGMHNIMNVVGLDADDVSSPFNCTELALPGDAGSDQLVSSRPSRTGRQQRGDLKSVVNVAGLVFDASHALLQVSDGSVVHYLHDQSGHPMLLQSSPSLCTTSIDDEASFGGPPAAPHHNKKMALARVGSQGMVLFAVSSFNENSARGAIMLRAMPGSASDSTSFRKYWGFNGLKKKRKQIPPLSSDTLVDSNWTPAVATKSNIQQMKTAREVTPADSLTPAPSLPATTKSNKSVRTTSKKRPTDEDQKLDSQLESIVHSATTHSPMPMMKKQKLAAQEPLITSPKRRGGRKKTTPRSAPMKKAEPEPESKQPKKKKVGFLGVTLLDQRITPNLPESCYQPRQRPTLLVEQLPISTVGSRFVNGPAAQSSLSKEAAAEGPFFQKHCEERRTLAAKHRAEHEMVRKKVLHSIRYVLSTWDIELNSTRPYTSIVESAKKWFDEALGGHQEVLDDILCTQVMEAESLASRQTSQLTNKRAPIMQVSFPFPEVFEQARQEMFTMLQ